MMKVVILAGGRGTRLAEGTSRIPKPMVEIGGRPILWHVMRLYAHFGLTEFIVCLGYQGYVIKEYFANFLLHGGDVTIDLGRGQVTRHGAAAEDWRVTLVDTGQATETGGRIRRIAGHLDAEEPFCLTYGDGLADIDIAGLIAFHRASGRQATVTVVRPPGRFGVVTMQDGQVIEFAEKPATGDINGGFFVLSPTVIDRIAGDDTVWERGPLPALAAEGQLGGWRHDGFWQPMDTPREAAVLNALWAGGAAPWKLWD